METPFTFSPRGRILLLDVLATVLIIADSLPESSRVDMDVMRLVLCLGLGGTAVWMAIRPDDNLPAFVMTKRARALLSNALISLVALLLSLVLAELGVRWLYRDVTTTSNQRGYFSNRWYRSQVRENHYGFRGPEFNEIKAPGVYRVAIIGDSFTYGSGIPEDRRFSNILDAELRPHRIEVLNFGLLGTNTPEHVTLLRNRILRLRPDFVLVQWYVNDVEGNSDLGRPRTRPLALSPRLHEALYASSVLYTLLDFRWTAWQMTRHMVGTYAEYMQRNFSDPGSKEALADSRLLRELIALCNGRDVPVGIVLFPDLGEDLGSGYPFQYLHNRVLDVCRQEQVACLDLRPFYERVMNRPSLWVSRFDSHPSALANAIAAREILSAFGQFWRAEHDPIERDFTQPAPQSPDRRYEPQ